MPSFEFLKAVNDKLITQESKVWDGKVLKHMTGTGPLYIGSKEQIPMAGQVIQSSSDSDSDTSSVSCIKKYCIREEKRKDSQSNTQARSVERASDLPAIPSSSS